MKQSVLLSFIIYHLSFSPAGAQTPWSLRQCTEYAVEHNISIKQREHNREQRELQLSTAKNSRLPDLNASASESFSFGRGLTLNNTYTNRSTSSTSLSLGTNVPLFTGFQIPNTIKLNQLNLEAATHDLEKARNDIRMQVAQAYVQILYNMEMADVAHRQRHRLGTGCSPSGFRQQWQGQSGSAFSTAGYSRQGAYDCHSIRQHPAALYPHPLSAPRTSFT